jgi:hypothetical protein
MTPLEQRHAAVLGRIFSGPTGPPRNEPLARFLLAPPLGVPPLAVKAFPRKGWVLLSDGTKAVLACIGRQSFGKNESERLAAWCTGYRVAHD